MKKFTDYQLWDEERRELKGDHYTTFSLLDGDQFAWWSGDVGEGYIIAKKTKPTDEK